MDKNFKEVTALGYEVLALVHDCCINERTGEKSYDIICKRDTDFEPYICGMYYDITDGTWAYGAYFDTYAQAINYLKARM